MNNKQQDNEKNQVKMSFVIIIIGLISISPLIMFHYYNHRPLSDADSIDSWVKYISVTAPWLQVIFAALTVAAAVWIATTVNDKIEERRKADERARELIRLSERMFDTEFYTKITAPMWEIVYKWLNWEGEAGDRYRAEVLSGELDISGRKFTAPENARGEIGNLIRFHPHYLPYDHGTESNPACTIHELSEHMVITTWIRFWVHLDLLVHEWKILSEEDAQKAFAGWYMCWAKFTDQYLACWKNCMENLGVQITQQNPLWNFERIHNTLTNPARAQLPVGLIENVWKQVQVLAQGSAQSRLWPDAAPLNSD